MIKCVEGIIVSEIPYKESSKIVNLFTKEFGIIGIIAKGTKNIKSPLMGLTSKLTFANFHINYKEKGLSTLYEVDVINNLKNIKKDITKISYASFITDLVTQVYKSELNKNIYDLYIACLLKINEGYNEKVITNILELKLLDYLGIKPVVDSCVICGNKQDIVTISSYKGGYLCKNCVTDEIIVNTKTIKLIRMFYYIEISKIEKIEISDNIINEINTFIDEYYDRYAGLYLKTKEFLKNLEKL